MVRTRKTSLPTSKYMPAMTSNPAEAAAEGCFTCRWTFCIAQPQLCLPWWHFCFRLCIWVRRSTLEREWQWAELWHLRQVGLEWGCICTLLNIGTLFVVYLLSALCEIHQSFSCTLRLFSEVRSCRLTTFLTLFLIDAVQCGIPIPILFFLMSLADFRV